MSDFLAPFGPAHNRRIKLKFTKIPINKNFAANEMYDAEKARNAVVKQFEQLKAIKADLEANDFKGRVSNGDWLKIKKEIVLR